MAANRTQLQNALHKPYDRLLFSREVLSPVFGSGFSVYSSLSPSVVLPNKSESTVIDQVGIYGKIRLDDAAEIICYEVLLQPKVRIEQSKVAIQQYVRKLLTAGQGALINFVSPSAKNVWRLTLVAKDSDVTGSRVKEKTTNAKRYTFLLGPSETCRTAAERFEALSTEKEITFQSLQDAFSVEKLSKAFFDEYTLHYQNFCDYLQESNYRKSVFNIDFPNNAIKEEKDKASKPIRDFVKKLLGRIVFLYFVQKKGWLGASDTDYTDGSGDFMRQLFTESGGDETFYSNWLTVLFFDTLNKKRANDDFIMPDGNTVKVPFLNGGLFDKEAFDEHVLTFPAKLFHHADYEDILLTEKNKGNARGFLDFLDAFNFTVYEDSPDDHTVAVDPEMLGHIFENLLEDNKDKGAFYTPKEIVHYMCQESLIEYLKNPLTRSADEEKPPLTPPQEGNLVAGTDSFVLNSPPMEGCQTKSDGVVNNTHIFETQSDGVATTPNAPSTPSDGVKNSTSHKTIPFRNSKNYFSLPYNPNLKKRARLLRNAGNLSEVLFWNKVKNKQFKGFDFDRQIVIGNYIVDFYCANTNVVVEIDGSSHNNRQEYDQARDEYLQSLGLTVIHIPVEAVLKNMDGVMQMLYNHPAMKNPPLLQSADEEKPPLTPPQEGNLVAGTDSFVLNSPPVEGCQTQSDGVATTLYNSSMQSDGVANNTHIVEMSSDGVAITPSASAMSSDGVGATPSLAFERIWEEKVRRLVKEKESTAFTMEELLSIDQLLDNVKICDPAIGSGAFPMGLLHEILSIKELIAYETGKEWNPAETKLNIIQNSIYGVDIEKGAVDIARLRFWLSLVVDEEKPRPLPNLDYKIVVGDSLISRFDGEVVEIDWEVKKGTQTDMFGNDNLQNRKQLLQTLTDKQRKYFDPTNKNKKDLALEIRNHKIDILINQLELMVKTEGLEQTPVKANFKDNKNFVSACELYQKTQSWLKTIDKLNYLKQHPDEPFNHFDWKLDFPEVLNPYLVPDEKQRGFDIVIGNPPYINVENIQQELRNLLFNKYQTCNGRTDIYIAFIENSLSLLKFKGILTFIVPYAYVNQSYGTISRQLLINKYFIREILDTSDYLVFESAKVKNIILSIKNERTNEATQIKKATSKKNFIENNFLKNKVFQSEFLQLKDSRFETNNINHLLSIKKLILINTVPFSHICFVAYGARLNNKFNSLKKDYYISKNYHEGYKKFTEGRNINRYIFSQTGWLNYQPEEHYNPMFTELFENEKLMFINIVKEKVRFALDTDGFYNSHTVINCVKWDLLKNVSHVSVKRNLTKEKIEIANNFSYKYLLGVLNSKLINWYFNSFLSESLHFYPDDAKELPIAKAENSKQSILSKLVNFMILLKSTYLSKTYEIKILDFFDYLIDGIVYELYFPELLQKYGCEIIKFLGELPEFTESMNDEEKMEICQKVYDRLSDASHPVRIHLEKMKKEIPEIRIIEGLEN